MKWEQILLFKKLTDIGKQNTIFVKDVDGSTAETRKFQIWELDPLVGILAD